MAQPHLGKLPPFNTIGKSELSFVRTALDMPLSGYIGGNPKGGRWVQHLSEEWKREFEVQYAIPCNSATSGLMAACMAVGIKPGDTVWTTPYSMSATAAVAKVLGAQVRFIDIEDHRFGLESIQAPDEWPRAKIGAAQLTRRPSSSPTSSVIPPS
jgi:dTDP-4-amino-4,6-dideoxygalactose transaminase